MIYEIASLTVQNQHVESFKHAFAEVTPLLVRAPGYSGHFLAQGIESPQQFTLIVRWRSLADHTPRFEASEDHGVFMMGIQGYLSAEPTVYHIEGISAGERAEAEDWPEFHHD